MGNECPQCSSPTENCKMRDVFKEQPKNRDDLDLSHIKKLESMRKQKVDQDQQMIHSMVISKNQMTASDTKHPKLQKSKTLKEKQHVNESPISVINQPLSMEVANLKTVQLKNGVKYIGNVLDGQPHEKGKVLWEDGTTLNGQFFLGQLADNQKVVIRTKQNSVYQGDIRDGKTNGKGKLTMADGTFYEGEWQRDIPNGFGKHQMSHGCTYEGSFKAGVKTGRGKLQFQGGMYEGQFQNDQFHGEGILILYNDRTTKGKWNNGVLEGEGQVEWESGEKYVGTFKNGMREGQGTYYFEDGREWKGEWQNDLQHGFGCYQVDNELIKSVWVCGVKKDEMRQAELNMDRPLNDKSKSKQSRIAV